MCQSGYIFDNTILNGIVVGFTRDAVATGAVSIPGTNFTPEPDLHALITNATSGEVTITRG